MSELPPPSRVSRQCSQPPAPVAPAAGGAGGLGQPDLSLKATNILARSLARAFERGMPELMTGFQVALEDARLVLEDRYAEKERELQAKQMHITPAKLGELQASFTAKVERAFKEKEALVVEPLRRRVAELEAQLAIAQAHAQAHAQAQATKQRMIEPVIKRRRVEEPVKLTYTSRLEDLLGTLGGPAAYPEE